MTDPDPDFEMRAVLRAADRGPDEAFARRVAQRVRLEARGRDRLRAATFRFLRDACTGLVIIACVLVAPLVGREAEPAMAAWIIAAAVCAWALAWDWAVSDSAPFAVARR